MQWIKIKSSRPSELGGAYWITNSGKTIDVSSDGFENGDHVGFLAASEDENIALAIGITKEDQNILKAAYENFDFDESIPVVEKIFNNGNIRVISLPNEVSIMSKNLNRSVVNRVIPFITKNTQKIYWDAPLMMDSKIFTKEEFFNL